MTARLMCDAVVSRAGAMPETREGGLGEGRGLEERCEELQEGHVR